MGADPVIYYRPLGYLNSEKRQEKSLLEGIQMRCCESQYVARYCPNDGEINRLETMTIKLRIRSESDWHDAA